MVEALVYVDVAEVYEGALDELKAAIAELAEFVEENEPQLVSYGAFLSNDGKRLSVVHVHADSASLDRHLEIAGPHFARFADLVTLKSIHLYGRPSDHALRRLREKLERLGAGDVVVYPPHAGFIRRGSGLK
jgi:quinol monooxygenase YgiN